MSKTIKDEESGEDIEVFTAEELEAQRLEAIENYKLENPDNSEEIERLSKELDDAKEKLKKADDKDKNFANLRKSLDDAEKKLQDTLKGVDEKINNVKREVLEGVNKEHYNETILKLAGDDEELKKKIEFNYKRLEGPATSKAEIEAKLQDAFRISASPEQFNALNTTVISSGNLHKLNFKSNNDQKLTPEEIELGKKLGSAGGLKLEDKDFK